MRWKFSWVWIMVAAMPMTVTAAVPADEVPLEQVLEEMIQLGNTPAIICEAIYGHIASRPTLADPGGKRSTRAIDYGSRRAALDHRMRADMTKALGSEELTKNIALSRETILATVAPEVFLGEHSERLYDIAAACDKHFNLSPQTSGRALKQPFPVVSHDECVIRYFTLALGLRQSNPRLSAIMHKRALHAASKKEALQSRFGGGPMNADAKRKFNTHVERIAVARVKSLQGDDDAVRQSFIAARACDVQYSLRATPVPGEGKEGERSAR